MERTARTVTVARARLGQRPLGVQRRPSLQVALARGDAFQAGRHQRDAGQLTARDASGGFRGGELVGLQGHRLRP